MASFVDVKKALRTQDIDKILPVLEGYIGSEENSYDRILQQMMYLAGSEHIDSVTPLGLVYLDSIRDLMTLYENTDKNPFPLITEAARYFSSLELEEYPKELIQVRPEDLQDPVFMGDLEEYVRDGDREKAVHETAKLLMMMDNHFYLIEVLTEIAASCIIETGMPVILAGAVLKSVEFVGSSRYKPMVYLLTDYLSRMQIGWDVRQISEEYDGEVLFQEYFGKAFENRGVYGLNVSALAYAKQIWESVRIKDQSIQRYLQRFLENKYEPMIDGSFTQEYSPREGTVETIGEAIRTGNLLGAGRMIIWYAHKGYSLGELYRSFISITLEGEPKIDPHDMILLNAYRTAAAYLNPPEQYQALLEAARLVHRLRAEQIIDN